MGWSLWLLGLGCLPSKADYEALREELQDIDGDGDPPPIYGGGDCDDRDPEKHSGLTWGLDLDGDGFGRADQVLVQCEEPSGYVLNTGDCDDEDAEIHPDAQEVCEEGIDDDCDGTYGACLLAPDTSTDHGDYIVFGAEEHDRFGHKLAPACIDTPESAQGLWVSAPTSIGGDARWNRLVLVPQLTAAVSVVSAGFDQIVESEEHLLGTEFLGCLDLRGSGESSIAIGAPDRDWGIEGGGAVYLLSEDFSGEVDERAAWGHIIAEHEGAQLGTALAHTASMDLASTPALVVGAPGWDQEQGAVFLFEGMTGDQLHSEALARVEGQNPGGEFGGVLEVLGDVDGDGFDDLAVSEVVGESLEAVGSVSVFLGPLLGTVDAASADSVFMGSSLYGYLGITQAQAGDLDGDGRDDLLVGALNDGDSAAELAGAVYAFVAPFPASGLVDDAAFTAFGHQDHTATVMLSSPSDLDGDGALDLVIGGMLAGLGGEVYYFRGLPEGVVTTEDATAIIAHPQEEALWGTSLATTVDLDGDGRLDLIGSAMHDSTTGVDAGSVVVFSGRGW